MGNLGWNIFEAAVTLFEQSVIFYFICSFLKHDFKTRRGKIVYVSGSILGTVLVVVLNSFTVYEWWLSAIYIVYWFGFSLIFIKGKVFGKLLAVILTDVVSISTSTLATSAFSMIFDLNFNEVYNSLSKTQNKLNLHYNYISLQKRQAKKVIACRFFIEFAYSL